MQIEQIDRDAAARVHERSCYEIVRIQGAQCRNGYGDTDPLVQDFARHRLAALSARPADGDMVERVGVAIAKVWYGPDFDPFSAPEYYNMAEQCARAAIAAITGENNG